MKFRCDRCGQKYAIADEKVAGKVVKIRCKKCNETITLRAEAPAEDVTRAMPREMLESALGDSRARPPPPPTTPDDAEWHAVIAGSQVGPVSTGELHAEMMAGRVSERTYVWCEGMDGWKPIREIPSLGGLLGTSAELETVLAAMGDTELSRGNGAGGEPLEDFGPGGLSPFEDAAEDEATATGEVDPFAQAMKDEAASQDPFAAVPDATDPDAPPRETTAMFILASGVNKRKSPWRIAAVVLGFVAVLGGLGALVASAGGVDLSGLIPVPEERTRAASSRGPVDEEEARRLRDRLLGVKDPEPAAGPRPARASGAREKPAAAALDEAPKVKEERKVEALSDNEKSALAALYGEAERGSFEVKSKREGKKGEPGVDSTKSPIDPQVVAKKIGQAQKAFQGCVQQELRRNPAFEGGRVTLTITVMPSGIVKDSVINDRRLDMSDVGRCIKRASKRIVFPSFSATDPVDFQVPLVLSTGY